MKLLEYASRKFVLAFTAMVGAFLLQIFGQGFGVEFVSLILGILGFYNGANVAQDYFLKDKKNGSVDSNE